MCKAPELMRIPTDVDKPEAADRPRGLLYSMQPFDTACLAGTGLDPEDCTTATAAAGSEIYSLIVAHIASCDGVSAFQIDIGHGTGATKRVGQRTTELALGLGVFSFEHAGKPLFALHTTVGQPQGTDCGVTLLRALVLLTPGKGQMATLTAFGDDLIAAADKTDRSCFTVYRWHVQHQYWMRDAKVPARPLSSVVLPAALKTKLITDVDDFVSEETADWYRSHGIPYKRSYLFWGAPGAGKTSLIQALAAKLQRNVCYLSPTHPEITDDNLKNAVQRCPSDSILVLEDVDALFGAKREKKIEKSPLTFSGLLNAIDGVGSAIGQIFILTTNHREQLDPALIRNGRVDLHVGFGPAEPEQIRSLFAQFYPHAAEGLAAAFETNLTAALRGQEVSMAALQHYFIMQRKKSAEAASEEVQMIMDEIEERKQKERPDDAGNVSHQADPKAGGQGGDEGEGGKAAPEAEAAPATALSAPDVHVHVHMGAPPKTAK